MENIYFTLLSGKVLTILNSGTCCFFSFFFYLSLKIRELSHNSLSLSLSKKVSANTIKHEIPLFFFIQEWTPEAAELIHLIW